MKIASPEGVVGFCCWFWCTRVAGTSTVCCDQAGGFGTSDDLSLVAHIGPDYWQDLKYSLSRSGHISRPIYGFVQTTLLHLFGSSYLLYNIFRLLLWAALIYIAHLVFNKSLGRNSTLLFLFFLSFPIFASSQLFNAMQMGYILSIIFFLLIQLPQIKLKDYGVDLQVWINNKKVI